ncbi:hypothetical protein HEB94_000510 [Actinopolymorpha pittospori]|uniref:Uncharacterized protein n=1 Tax=Actinopolymorpha pittospori TaxID=648752 RepID=A0A927R5T4_9ACTN|nr:hypothetical protein [Actinopolymorpha pittospori]
MRTAWRQRCPVGRHVGADLQTTNGATRTYPVGLDLQDEGELRGPRVSADGA